MCPEHVDGLPHVRSNGPERQQLVDFLEYMRVVLRRKAEGLTHAQLHTALAPSSLTLGGLLRHMTLVEDIWFADAIGGRELEPWASAPWEEDHDWEMTTAPGCSVDELFEDYDASLERSREVLASVASLDQLSRKKRRMGETPDVRWILIHMIEEYARHGGHADYLREALDGLTGD